ncbi:hypothetical protein [Streptomyces sp. NPDC058644]|uniref:hypothetical protein n=1 Tax=unclassified Streptomyces TaxID=2593676 RepID=UPI00365CB541
MIEDLAWEEFSGDPDKYIHALEERENDLGRETFKVRQELRLMRQLKKHKDTALSWREHGIPDQRQAEPEEDKPQEASVGSQGPTRKDRIRGLLGQDPQRLWKVKEIAAALGEPQKEKSVRVAVDEMARAGEIIKHPGAQYQYRNLPPH